MLLVYRNRDRNYCVTDDCGGKDLRRFSYLIKECSGSYSVQTLSWVIRPQGILRFEERIAAEQANGDPVVMEKMWDCTRRAYCHVTAEDVCRIRSSEVEVGKTKLKCPVCSKMCIVTLKNVLKESMI